MNLKKYRACLVIFIAAMIAAGIIYYVNSTKKTEIPTDGMLVKDEQEYSGEENV